MVILNWLIKTNIGEKLLIWNHWNIMKVNLIGMLLLLSTTKIMFIYY